jgi:hypothetical protein
LRLEHLKADERALGLFDLEAVQDKGHWKRRWNSEIRKLYYEPDLAEYIKINRLKWAGHDMRMDNNRTTKRMFDTRPEGKIGIGRPKLRWGVAWTRISDF